MTSATDACGRLAAHTLPVDEARFVDSARASALNKLGVSTIGDLLRHYPARYLDLSHVVNLADVRIGSDCTVVGRVHEIKIKKPRPRLTITEVAIVDGTGVLLGVWFNQPYIERRFAVGESVAFAGKVELDYGLKQIKSPFVEKLSAEDDRGLRTTGHVLPVHRATEGLSTNWLRRLVAAAVDDYSEVPDHLPAQLREERGLMPLSAALRCMHFPSDLGQAAEARRRLAYDEVLMLQLYMALRRHALTEERTGTTHVIDGPRLAELHASVPFTLTTDQDKAIEEILSDMASRKPMNRLLLGDVGTGKTLVAAHALAAVADTGTQAAMMAPTEVLAEQYVKSVAPLLDAAGIPWGILTGSTTAAARRELLGGVADGKVTVLFGTHALLEESVAFKRLSLAIVDEQHRFGVNQRLGLRGKGLAADLLVMTATPIPRSLALTLYGDMETSYLRERPNARPPVTTTVLSPPRRPEAYRAISDAAQAGHQAYVVCALVEESDSAQARAATRECDRLRKAFPKLRVGLLTGRQRAAEKTRAMQEFRDGAIDVLVSTTVIEVGVDVPNATVMVVENAERFGLAQLHQLRGRVGRGEVPGRVFLVSEARTDDSKERLRALAETADGFALAELDLKLRGEGHILGDQQHGLPALRLVSVLTDGDLIEAARNDARRLVAEDPHLRLDVHRPVFREVRRAFASAWEWVSSG